VIALLCLAAIQQTTPAPAIWVTKTSLAALTSAEAAAKPFVVIPSGLVDDPKVAELRAAGAKLVLSFGIHSFGPDVKTCPTEWFAQNLSGVDKPQRGGETLTLEDDEALAYQVARAKAFSARAGDFAGLVLNVDLRTDQGSFRYAAADRRRAIAATGLDPVDFDDPLETINASSRRTPMPKRLVDALTKEGQSRARRVVDALVPGFQAKRLPIALRVDPALLGASPERQMAAYGAWTTFLDLPGVTDLWLPVAALESAGKVDSELQSRRTGRHSITLFGYAKTLPEKPIPQPNGKGTMRLVEFRS